MTPQKPPRLAAALLKRLSSGNEPLIGDLHEQFQRGRSRGWYWSQVAGVGVSRCAHDQRLQVCIALIALVGIAWSVGWWSASRLAVPVLLGVTFTSLKLWRFHRSSLVLLYAIAVAMSLPNWMVAEHLMPSAGDRVFWVIARVLAGYGVVGVLLVPFLILRLGRSGPLAERPISLSLSR